MLSLPRLLLQLRLYQIRLYTKQSIYKMNNNMKQVHQETLRYIDPYPKIKIKTDIFIKIQPTDVFNYPNGNVFIAELHGGHAKNATAAMNIDISDDDKRVVVDITKLVDNSDFHCMLYVPIKSDLYVDGKNSVCVNNLFSNEITVRALNKIITKDIKADKISLNAGGEIKCNGQLLANEINIKAVNDMVLFSKILGNNFKCKTKGGNILVQSCYTECSMFETETGHLNLKNVHNKTKIIIHQPEGQLVMAGVNANMQVESKASKISLQLSELHKDNLITSEGDTTINISDRIVDNTSFYMNTGATIVLHPSVSYLNKYLIESQKNNVINYQVPKETSTLTVQSNSGISLSKLSWENAMTAMFNNFKK